jgi:glycosyltransferase involved in cell wall biosynthesis
MRLGYSLADAVVAVSFGVRDDLTELSGLPASRYCVVHNPVPPPEPDPDAADEALLRWWGDGGCARIIAIGSLKPAKDYPTLLRAFAVASRKQAVRLLIVGEGPLRGEIEALIELLGLSDRVRLPGHVPNPYVWLNHADQFVLSSAWEGFGNVIVEAMHCGVPVVSTDCRSGPREILDDGKYGRLVPVGDVDALARAMLDSLTEYHDPAMLRARAHQFSVAQAADDYLALLLPGLASR